MESNAFASTGARALEARDRLAVLARNADERTMPEIGATALFEEALLSALHAHVAELKMVAR